MRGQFVKTEWELTPERFLTTKELAQLLAKAEELWIIGEAKRLKRPIRDAVIIQTAISTGLRCSEICHLRVADLRIANGSSHVHVRSGKGGVSRNVHIGREYKRFLKRYVRWKADNNELTPDSYLIRSARAEKFSPSGLWRRWKRYCPKTLHCARHTNATLMYQASGNNLRMVQKQLGHSRITTTQIYADVLPEVMVANMTAMESLTRSIRRKHA